MCTSCTGCTTVCYGSSVPRDLVTKVVLRNARAHVTALTAIQMRGTSDSDASCYAGGGSRRKQWLENFIAVLSIPVKY